MKIEASKFIGLTKKSSQDLAEKHNVIFRLIRIDNNNYFEYPTENDDRSSIMDRICIEIDQGKVTVAKYQ